MQYRDRNGQILGDDSLQDQLLRFLYGHAITRALIKLLILPPVSRLGGLFLSSPLSRPLIGPFIRINRMDLSQCVRRSPEQYRSYNDFFTRRLIHGARPLAGSRYALISPCDGKLAVYPIDDSSSFCIKHTPYTLRQLLRDSALARRFAGGYVWIFRLTVDDYHRYCYVADGLKSGNRKIPGLLHTVNPAAGDVYPIYKENSREYSLLRTNQFGTILMMEVGALLVGRIENLHGRAHVRRGQEKGNFAFGGSTILLLTQKGRVIPDQDLLDNTQQKAETVVRMGEAVGSAPVCQPR